MDNCKIEIILRIAKEEGSFHFESKKLIVF